jgi:hypothetical protein
MMELQQRETQDRTLGTPIFFSAGVVSDGAVPMEEKTSVNNSTGCCIVD